MNLNQVTLLGSLSCEPVFDETPNGTPVCKFIVETKTKKRGEVTPTFHNISVIGKSLCDVVALHAKAGKNILVRGTLEYWNDTKKGTRLVDVKAEYVEFA